MFLTNSLSGTRNQRRGRAFPKRNAMFRHETKKRSSDARRDRADEVIEMTDPRVPEQPEENRGEAERQSRRMPFDNAGLNEIPGPTNDDPPYRSWWVVTDTDKR
jgi:hypothetical protein